MDKRVNCKQLNKKNVNEQIAIRGFVHKVRKMGKMNFIDLRDMHGITQLIIDNEKIKTDPIKNEYIIDVVGKVVLRKDANKDLATGEIEVVVSKIEILSIAEQTPFLIRDETDGLEPLRLKHRYLDLRRPIQKNMIIKRHEVIKAIRDFYNKEDFIEVETPILTKSTPEGARDFVVPSFNNTNKFYALPQSPQLYKQLLMIGGFEKYYQIARCFRDEASRKDRQPEFTQLDVENSFLTQEEIMSQTERMLAHVFKKALNVNVKIPFNKITYHDALYQYGSDKPDLRFDMKIHDVTNQLKNSEMNLFKDAIKNKKTVKTLLVNHELSKKQIKHLEDLVKKSGGMGLGFYNIAKEKVEDKSPLTGSVAKFIKPKELNDLIKVEPHQTALFIVDEEVKALNILGAVRYELGRVLDLVKPDDFNFV
jgi:aspartyl-tRNA synthetase